MKINLKEIKSLTQIVLFASYKLVTFSLSVFHMVFLPWILMTYYQNNFITFIPFLYSLVLFFVFIYTDKVSRLVYQLNIKLLKFIFDLDEKDVGISVSFGLFFTMVINLIVVFVSAVVSVNLFKYQI